ncbi:hypothetical protein CAAN1_11S00650 [[Candida] anglica]|uniref:PH-response regulator protein palC n=1 Tax=[Candida] anglica TaxID=148631 RepID=A0ABP0EL47_9ASCO
MIVLPNTPPIPQSISIAAGKLNSYIVSERSGLLSDVGTNSELVRYVVALEEYLEHLFDYCAQNCPQRRQLEDLVEYSSTYVLSESLGQLPWTLKRNKNKKIEDNFFQRKRTPNSSTSLSPDQTSTTTTPSWTLANEIEITVVAIALTYSSLGSQNISELISAQESTVETTEKWKQVANLFKSSLSFVSFGSMVNRSISTDTKLNGMIYHFLHKTNNISIQMSILAKSSWINRQDYNKTESFKSSNNSTLARVAIYVLDELHHCIKILSQLQTSLDDTFSLNYKFWSEYLLVIEKYATAYAGLFLSIEHYQQDKVGEAIGLVNFSLLTLQKKKFDALQRESGGKLDKLKGKFQSRSNESYINKLESVTSLNIDKSAFQSHSDVILTDLTYLFDQLVLLHVKFTKENNNLKFDKVVSWSDMKSDSKWPLGCSIPVSAVVSFMPRCLKIGDNSHQNQSYSGRGAYY